MSLLANFESKTLTTRHGSVYLKIGGSGEPLVMLHGYPQTHVCWHRLAPQLARQFTVILPDVRGYGRSCLPSPDQSLYSCSKRASALDIVDAMSQLGFEHFTLVGHDRGARVGYRLALDHPEKLVKFVSLDVVPTVNTWEGFNAEVAVDAYHWSFLAQNYPLPENLIGQDPIYYLEHTLASWTQSKDLSSFDPEALQAYRQAFSSPEAVHAYCNDYRAGHGYDLQADRQSRLDGKRIHCPMLVLWAAGPLGGIEDVETGEDMISIWKHWCDDVSGTEIDSGHFMAEENPEQTLGHLLEFLCR